MKIDDFLGGMSVQDMIHDTEPTQPTDPPKPDAEGDDSQKDDAGGNEPSQPEKPNPPKPADKPVEGDDEPEDDKGEGGDDPDQGEDDENPLSVLQKKFGYDFGDQQFEESIDGIFEMSRAAAEKMAESQLDQFFESFPDLAEYAEFRMNGGDPKTYFESMSKERDYSQVSVTEDDVATQRAILGELLTRQGFDDESKKSIIDNMAKGGALFEQSKAALPILSKITDTERKKLIDDQKQKALEDENKKQETLNQIKTTIKTGNLKGIQIPESEKDKFSKWMFQPGKDGKTGRNAAKESLTLEDKLALEYLVFKGFKLSDLIQKRVETEKAKGLKGLMKDKSGSRMKDDSSQREALSIPSISDLLG